MGCRSKGYGFKSWEILLLLKLQPFGHISYSSHNQSLRSLLKDMRKNLKLFFLFINLRYDILILEIDTVPQVFFMNTRMLNIIEWVLRKWVLHLNKVPYISNISIKLSLNISILELVAYTSTSWLWILPLKIWWNFLNSFPMRIAH